MNNQIDQKSPVHPVLLRFKADYFFLLLIKHIWLIFSFFLLSLINKFPSVLFVSVFCICLLPRMKPLKPSLPVLLSLRDTAEGCKPAYQASHCDNGHLTGQHINNHSLNQGRKT